jgi:adenosylhomocysteinase
MFDELRDGTILLNAGRGDNEIAVKELRRVAEQAEQVSNQVVRYQLTDGRRITVLGGGNPLNIVLNAGSPEPILLHFAALALVLEWAARTELPPGETIIPTNIERQVAELALQSLQLGRS